MYIIWAVSTTWCHEDLNPSHHSVTKYQDMWEAVGVKDNTEPQLWKTVPPMGIAWPQTPGCCITPGTGFMVVPGTRQIERMSHWCVYRYRNLPRRITAIVRKQAFLENERILAAHRQKQRNRQQCEKMMLSNMRPKQSKSGENMLPRELLPRVAIEHQLCVCTWRNALTTGLPGVCASAHARILPQRKKM